VQTRSAPSLGSSGVLKTAAYASSSVAAAIIVTVLIIWTAVRRRRLRPAPEPDHSAVLSGTVGSTTTATSTVPWDASSPCRQCYGKPSAPAPPPRTSASTASAGKYGPSISNLFITAIPLRESGTLWNTSLSMGDRNFRPLLRVLWD